ncbi:hypothetical protein SAMN05421736_11424 [Evansella caseinilytica]|uniref:Uncharacterized protein n=1 Tax=Evansella caseinilytica TaxID=1503961 RepID=A0A1H3TEG8_9BACI|nr:hypothetical protein [Evansella caseinilytica]SDZ48075.1 hypothetical protein SAMN05421736_11424 [Evansella caseinilytica]
MLQKKKFLFTILAVVVVLLVWVGYSVNQPPKWTGATEDGQWRAEYDYTTKGDPRDDWLGNVYWQGEGEVSLIEVEFTKNGELFHKAEYYGEAILSKKHNSQLFFHTFEAMFSDKNDRLQLTIRWEDDAGAYEDKIDLTPKNHYFFIPVFLR